MVSHHVWLWIFLIRNTIALRWSAADLGNRVTVNPHLREVAAATSIFRRCATRLHSATVPDQSYLELPTSDEIHKQSSDEAKIRRFLANINSCLNQGGLLINVAPADNQFHTTSLDIHNASQLIGFCLELLRDKSFTHEYYLLHNILGRLAHGELNNPELAVSHYTNALSITPNSSVTFRNLGAAYHAMGNLQLAFASYQQAIQLCSSDYITYLKLGYLYEDLAWQDWMHAVEHSAKCYAYYLAFEPDDITVLLRLANLLADNSKPTEAVCIYDKINCIDSSCLAGWYNKAIAQMKMGDFAGAQFSYQRALLLNSSLPVASHMLDALSGIPKSGVDRAYIMHHFDSIATSYDKRMKQMQYSAPRIIRQELSKIYKRRYKTVDEHGQIVFYARKQHINSSNNNNDYEQSTGGITAKAQKVSLIDPLPMFTNDCHPAERSFMHGALSVLDLGCGTGLVGAWLREYAHHLAGVDVSPAMLRVAQDKRLYDQVHCTLLQDFAANRTSAADGMVGVQKRAESYDLIVAADVVAYVGSLDTLLPQVVHLLKPQGLLVFTYEPLLVATNESDHVPEGRNQLPPYQLQRTGRFSFSDQYINRLIAKLDDKYSLQLCMDFNASMSADGSILERLVIVQMN